MSTLWDGSLCDRFGARGCCTHPPSRAAIGENRQPPSVPGTASPKAEGIGVTERPAINQNKLNDTCERQLSSPSSERTEPSVVSHGVDVRVRKQSCSTHVVPSQRQSAVAKRESCASVGALGPSEVRIKWRQAVVRAFQGEASH